MTSSEFLSKFKSKYLWGNLLAMLVVVILLGIGVRFGIDAYTHHGESIAIPDIRHKNWADAEKILENAGLKIEVSDTGYVKTLPPDCILEQSPAPGELVKSGHVIYVTVNASSTPSLALPDVIDNSSLREAMAKLTAMGFKLGAPQFIPGEQDWVYGILVNGRHVVAGDRIPVGATLIIQVGNGQRDASDSIDMVGNPFEEEPVGGSSDEDEFEEVTEADAEETSGGQSSHNNSTE
ncbi:MULTISPECIES: PASTA domain-containing protein [Segatella]|jgi:beta-lactam-binding protein with PASTA domain|uniref:Pasta domain protein n=2 Tax=Segatella TaxID=2974251 RepID=D8DU62_9BACT|nr:MULTISPECIES: PASTA domain-containing protein [Segatella]MBQ3858834.1 PASTA domain-containing protein [Prevotella sp.]EFI73007.1 pasta domain protein [Segatella baroniae B14]MDR4931987.1 PASTA domain-containing protein [Segatella bryantii]MEE3414931.1 PASTA domain-containing protein [Prevotella sp.]OYP55458.1 PASTA domain-containing protein [Segatella bryantii]